MPYSYERYLSIDDEEVFGHLVSLNPAFKSYNDLVQRLILSQIRGQRRPVLYYIPLSCY
jgi:hypothetical protein